MTTIFISGAIANKPFNGGNAWAHLSYVFGFRKLGFDVHFVEQLHPAACTNEVATAYFRHIAEEAGLQGKMTLIAQDMQTLEGVPFSDLLDIAESSVLLINISGHLTLEALTSRIRRRAYVDLDPGFTQHWHAAATSAFKVSDHHYYFTIGENIGRSSCLVPLSGICWRRMRQPVVLEQWPVSSAGDDARFTTVASWRGPFGPVEHRGQLFGSKVHEFRKYAGVPGQTTATFEIALDIHSGDYKDRDLLLQNLWRLSDPRKVVPDMSSFHRYVQESGAEFSVAQQMYVGTQCGWFSDRTVRYLASGKPALVQDTGFTHNLPVGSGLLAFSTPEEAVNGTRAIIEHYSEHAAAARGIAEQYFDSNRVLGQMLDEMSI